LNKLKREVIEKKKKKNKNVADVTAGKLPVRDLAARYFGEFLENYY
jgi:hypothetical protein